ncbi:MAG: type II secretion system protein GspK [Candidatus Omnitrophica bacterium]|nr:type II secretion system protein GspK [Candidatus Omnitrophota bacterium]
MRPRASILIIVLWSVFLLTIFAVVLSYGVRQKLEVIKRIDSRSNLRYLNEACIEKTIFDIKRVQKKEYFVFKNSTPSENGNPLMTEVDIIDDKPGGNAHSFELRSSIYTSRVSVFDEARKLNINMASLPVMERLFMIVLGFDKIEASELAASIVDWRDTDSLLTLPLGSAEDSYYRNFPYSYEAKDGPFEALEELLLVKGVTREVFEKLNNYITIYGDGKININTAPEEVLNAVGFSSDMVSKIIALRQGDDGIPGTADDIVIDAPGNLQSLMQGRFKLGEANLQQLELLADAFTVTTSYFTIKASGLRAGGSAQAQTVCVVDRMGNILRWIE